MLHVCSQPVISSTSSKKFRIINGASILLEPFCLNFEKRMQPLFKPFNVDAWKVGMSTPWLNSDASIIENDGMILRESLRDSSEDVLKVFTKHSEPSLDVQVAEALLCLQGILLAKEQQIKHLLIEIDCLEFVSVLKKKEPAGLVAPAAEIKDPAKSGSEHSTRRRTLPPTNSATPKPKPTSPSEFRPQDAAPRFLQQSQPHPEQHRESYI